MIRPELSSVALVREAAICVNDNRSAIARAIIFPILCTFTLDLLNLVYLSKALDQPYQLSTIWGIVGLYLILFAQVPFYVMIATSCHRIVLLGESSQQNRWGIFWTERETRFLGWCMILGLIAMVISTIFLLPVWIFIDSASGWQYARAPIFAGVIAYTYFDGRFGLVLPATAIGMRSSLRKSWRLTAGNSWAIFAALLIPIFAMWVIDITIFDTLQEDAVPLADVIQGLLLYPLVVMGIVIVTIAYRKLEAPSGIKGPGDSQRAWYFDQ